MVGQSKSTFSFKLTTDVRFGTGITRSIGKHMPGDFKKLGLVIDSGVFGHELVHDLMLNLKESCDIPKVFKNTASEPDYDYLDNCKKEFINIELDGLIGIGGGSTLDLTKGIAVLMTNPGEAINYRGFDLVKNPSLPVIAVPTTAGTGSEVTPSAVFINKKDGRKLGINTEYNRPVLAILDPLLTLSCPRSVTISSGMDALTHALESFVAKETSPISRIFSKEAISLIFNNLPSLVNDMDNIELRTGMLLGSYYAGIAMMNAGGGPAGAMSYALGSHYSVPHGLAGAVFLSRVVKLNIEIGCLAYAPLYDVTDGTDRNLSEVERNKKFSEALGILCEKLSIPQSLTDFGVSRDDVDFLINESFWLRPAMEQNPVPFTEREVKRILASMT